MTQAEMPAPGGKHWLLAERRAALPPKGSAHRPVRKRIHLVCCLVFLLLPFTNLMRFDLPRQRFYFGGAELAISEFSILFFALMFLMFMLAASAIVYGRIYCSYACPQMIFSEWSVSLERWADRKAQSLRSLPKAARSVLRRGLFYGILAAASVLLAFAFTAYFVPPADLLSRLLRLDLVTVGGITGASVTLLTFLDLTLLRLKFCTTICPYGYLQGIVQDRRTLLVEYQDPGRACIDCGKCVKVCEMGIDIRKGPFQIECVHCGDCIDACEDVLRKVGHEGLIRYSWGEAKSEASLAAREPWPRRIGLRDAKRVVILLVMVGYLCALGFALSLHRAVMVRIAPDRTTLFTLLPDGRVVNRVRLDLGNRSSRAVTVRVWTEGLPGAQVGLAANPIPLAPGESLETTFDLAAPVWPGAQELNPIRVLVQSSDRPEPEVSEMMFIMPEKGK